MRRERLSSRARVSSRAGHVPDAPSPARSSFCATSRSPSMIIALARPRTGARVENITTSGINIVLAIDLSSSMLAEDFRPSNRLEVAKAKVKQFIIARQSDRIGIVAFAGEALTQVPLTTDYNVVLKSVDNLQAGQLEDGTAIGTGIATAANRLRDAPGKSRVMIVLTDGVNNRGDVDPLSAAKAAAVYGIKIYGIGVGSEGVAPVPVGRGVFGLRFENAARSRSTRRCCDRSPRSAAEDISARATRAALERIYSQIDRLERVPVQSRSYVRYTELYRWFARDLLSPHCLLELGARCVEGADTMMISAIRHLAVGTFARRDCCRS